MPLCPKGWNWRTMECGWNSLKRETSMTRQNADSEKTALAELLRSFGQEHLLAFWDELSAGQRERISAQIRSIDFAQLAKLREGKQSGPDWKALAMRAVGPPAIRLDGHGNQFSVMEARTRGEESLKNRELGVVLVAGGQGTRLGFDHPKGMFPIGPVSGATLFQILLEKVLAVGNRYQVRLPLYLMTSPATHDETVAYLGEHRYFGLPAEDVRIFCQGTMPAVDAESGRLLLAEQGSLFLSPDGHGGLLRALAASGSLDNIERRGLRQLFYMQVDNPLVRVCDPEFVGYHLLTGSQVSTQVVAKRTPTDRVGNVVAIDGKVQIIEYSDLPKEAGERRNPDGGLTLWAGNVAVHVLDVAFLRDMQGQDNRLPFHLAKKKVPYVDPSGTLIEPERENAIKFERFIFDLLPAANRSIAVEVDEARTFAPVKNGSGAERDSPETVQVQMTSLFTEWLRQAGATAAENVAIEISPLAALGPDDLRARVSPGVALRTDTYIDSATYLQPTV